MLVRDAMTHRAVTVGPDETLQEAAVRMREQGVGALVVREDGRVAGLLTDRDIVVRAVALGASPAGATVRTAMTTQVLDCREEEPLEAAVARMERGAVRRAVVLDAAGRLTGMLSVDDVALLSPSLAGGILEHALAPGRPAPSGTWPWWEEPVH